MADGKRVVTEGSQFMERRVGEEVTPLHQFVRTQVDDKAVVIQIEGMASGQRVFVPCIDPAVIQHYLDRDYAEFVVSLAERPASPEPDRVPFGYVPDGSRVCWLCDGVGSAEGVEGWEDCAVCQGNGVIPIEAESD